MRMLDLDALGRLVDGDGAVASAVMAAESLAPRELSVNTGLANENARLRQENKRMRAAIDQISGTLAILKASAQ